MNLKSEPESTVIELVPSNPRAAPISAIVPTEQDDGVTLIAGKGSFFEIPKEGYRYTNLPFADEVRSICLAVIAGRLQESVVLAGEEVLQGKGIIQLAQPITVRWRQLSSFNPFRKKDKKKFHYEPY